MDKKKLQKLDDVKKPSILKMERDRCASLDKLVCLSVLLRDIASYVCDESMKAKNSNLTVRMLLLYDS